MSDQTLMSFDYGHRFIGVAVGNQLTGTARPLATVLVKEGRIDWERLDQIVREWQPKALILGIPVNMDGSNQSLTQDARAFGQLLVERFQLPVYEEDERLTTVESRAQLFEAQGYRGLKKKAAIDAWSAKLILESWMLRHISKSGAP